MTDTVFTIWWYREVLSVVVLCVFFAIAGAAVLEAVRTWRAGR